MKMDDVPAQMPVLMGEIETYLTDSGANVMSMNEERRRNRRRVHLATGTLNLGRLCWSCAAHGTYRRNAGGVLSVCEKCYHVDAAAASLLGLDNLMPQTREPSVLTFQHRPLGLPQHCAEELIAVHAHPQWRQQWRRDLVQGLAAELDLGCRYDYPLTEWTREVGWSWSDCAHRYSSFVDVFAPGLVELLPGLADPEWLETLVIRGT